MTNNQKQYSVEVRKDLVEVTSIDDTYLLFLVYATFIKLIRIFF